MMLKSLKTHLTKCSDAGGSPIIGGLALKNLKVIQSHSVSSEYESVFHIEYLNTEEEMSKEFQNRKTYKCYVDAKYKCQICFVGFKYEKLYTFHKKCHNQTSGNVVCDICSKRFDHKGAMNAHRLKHEIVFKCKRCPLVTSYRSSMMNHYDHHMGTELTCKICGLSYKSKSSYNTHLNRRHSAPHVCTTCGRAFFSEKGLKSHRALTHKGEASAVEAQVKCSHCELSFPTQEVLDTHVGVSHKKFTVAPQPAFSVQHKTMPQPVKKKMTNPPENTLLKQGQSTSYVCTTCGRAFVTELGLKAHRNKVHMGEAILTAAERTEKCPHCEFSFPSQEVLDKHLAVSHAPPKVKKKVPPSKKTGKGRRMAVNKDEYPISCRVCNAAGRNRHWLNSHFLSEHPTVNIGLLYADVLTHLCHICGKGFVSKYNLKEHVKKHSSLRPFACDECPARFQQRGGLRVHLLTHRPPGKPCQYCGKKFITSANLLVHTRIHIGDRRYKCQICGKGFIHPGSVTEHVRGVHEKIRRTKGGRKKKMGVEGGSYPESEGNTWGETSLQ